ncbi:hypothetical protein EDB85DRAFT_2146062 [Lactarius pseudohatsudake]|nr:hypothetical protein EDB85DRAFT_2146062 [Lactarius pseudohatsudake]
MFTSPAAPCVAAAAQEQRKCSRSGIPQTASSADMTASAPQSRGHLHVTYKPQRTSRINSSDYRSRSNARRGTRRGSFKNDSQGDEKHKCNVQQRRHSRAHVRGAVGDRRRLQALATAFTTRAATERATFVQAAPPRIHLPAATCAAAAAQEQRKRSRSSVHQLASSADLTASAPRSRGGSYVTYRSRRTLHIDYSVYRSRDRMRGGTRRSSLKSDTQRSKESSARLQQRQQQRYARADVRVASDDRR